MQGPLKEAKRTRPDRCVECGVPMVRTHYGPAPEGTRKHAGGGKFRRCYDTANRVTHTVDPAVKASDEARQLAHDQEALNAYMRARHNRTQEGPTMTALHLPEPPTWASGALCAQTDPELFFPTKGDWVKVAAAKRVCADCPVQAKCLKEALDDPTLDGIWGGTNPRERTQLRVGAA